PIRPAPLRTSPWPPPPERIRGRVGTVPSAPPPTRSWRTGGRSRTITRSVPTIGRGWSRRSERWAGTCCVRSRPLLTRRGSSTPASSFPRPPGDHRGRVSSAPVGLLVELTSQLLAEGSHELELLLFVVTTFQRVADVHRRVGGEESGRGRAQALVIRLVEYGVAAVTGGEFGPVDAFEAVELLTPPVSVLEVFDEFFGVGTQVLHDTFVLGVVEGDVDPQRRVEGPVLVVLLGVGGLLGAARQDAFDPFQVAFLRVLVLVDVFVVVQVLTLDPGTLGVREVVDDVVEQLTTGRQRGVGATAEEVPHHQATRDEKDDHGDGDADEEGAYTRVPRWSGWARRTGHAWSRWSAGRTGRTGRWWGEPGPTRRHVLSTRLLRTVPAVLALGLPRL